MKAAERPAAQSRGTPPWEVEEESSFLDLSITRIPGVKLVYQSLKEWQEECEPRVYPHPDEEKRL